MVKLIKCELTYCNQCHMPAICGVFELVGWKHWFRLCAHCIEGMAKQICDWPGEQHGR